MGKCPVLPSWSPILPSWSPNLPSWSPNFTVLESEFLLLSLGTRFSCTGVFSFPSINHIFLDLSKMSDCVNMLGLCLPTDMWFNQEEKKKKMKKLKKLTFSNSLKKLTMHKFWTHKLL